MRRYETIFISHPDLSEDEQEKLTHRMQDILRQQEGEIIQVQQWGSQRLAYKIKKQSRGYYTLLDYASMPAAVDELERVLRLEDNVLKYLTVKLADKVDPEAILKAIEEGKKTEIPKKVETPEPTVEEKSSEEAPEPPVLEDTAEVNQDEAAKPPVLEDTAEADQEEAAEPPVLEATTEANQEEASQHETVESTAIRKANDAE